MVSLEMSLKHRILLPILLSDTLFNTTSVSAACPISRAQQGQHTKLGKVACNEPDITQTLLMGIQGMGADTAGGGMLLDGAALIAVMRL